LACFALSPLKINIPQSYINRLEEAGMHHATASATCSSVDGLNIDAEGEFDIEVDSSDGLLE